MNSMSIRTGKAWLPGQHCCEDPSVPTFVEPVLLPLFYCGNTVGAFHMLPDYLIFSIFAKSLPLPEQDWYQQRGAELNVRKNQRIADNNEASGLQAKTFLCSTSHTLLLSRSLNTFLSPLPQRSCLGKEKKKRGRATTTSKAFNNVTISLFLLATQRPYIITKRGNMSW